jgi:protein-S-isoprenylcysteine O-methyltransferase Ste14
MSKMRARTSGYVYKPKPVDYVCEVEESPPWPTWLFSPALGLACLALPVVALRGSDVRALVAAVHLWLFLLLYRGTLGNMSSELAQERVSSPTSPLSKAWDKRLTRVYGPLMGPVPFLSYCLFPGLPWLFECWLVWPLLLLGAGQALFFWCTRENNFFSTVVRIQSDRNHRVCRTGPYSIVRHPGYVGFCLSSVGMALLLPTWPVVVSQVAAVGLLVVRTAWEDATLHAELEGYAEYAQSVRFRLLPYVF